MLWVTKTPVKLFLQYRCAMPHKAKPIFNKRIFWDIVFENIDYDAKANFVIERVFKRGDVDDICNCRHYYGDKKVTTALLNAKFKDKFVREEKAPAF